MEAFRGLEESRCCSYPQEGQGGGSKELEGWSASPYTWEGDGATNPGNQTYWKARKQLGVVTMNLQSGNLSSPASDQALAVYPRCPYQGQHHLKATLNLGDRTEHPP